MVVHYFKWCNKSVTTLITSIRDYYNWFVPVNIITGVNTGWLYQSFVNKDQKTWYFCMYCYSLGWIVKVFLYLGNIQFSSPYLYSCNVTLTWGHPSYLLRFSMYWYSKILLNCPTEERFPLHYQKGGLS